MDTRAGEIGDRETIRLRRSIEWQVHCRFAEYCSAPNAWGLDLTTMAVLRAIPGLGRDAALRRPRTAQRAVHTAYSRFGLDLSPKIAVPTRTSVAPSSTATGKSCVIPIDSCA